MSQREAVNRVDTLKINYLREYGLGSKLGGYSVFNSVQRQSNRFASTNQVSTVSSTQRLAGKYDPTIVGNSKVKFRGSNGSFNKHS